MAQAAMKIEYFTVPPSPPQARWPDPQLSFASLLDGPIDTLAKAETAEVAIGFQRLGMFGQSAAVVDATHAVAPSPDRLATGSPVEGARSPWTAPALPVWTPVTASSAQASEQQSTIAMFTLTRASSAVGSDAAGCPPPEQMHRDGAVTEEDRPSQADGADGPQDRRSIPQTAASRPGPTVVVVGKTGSAGALDVVVSAAGLTPDESRHFRQRAQALLAETGAALDKVLINGEHHIRVDPRHQESASWR